METRSKKRAGASAPSPPPPRAAKRPRTSSSAVTTRSRSRKPSAAEKGKQKATYEEEEPKLGQNLSSGIDDAAARIFPNCSALQGILKKLGRNFPEEGIFPARLMKILTELRADGEEDKQIEALTQLCNVLSMGNGDSLRLLPVDSFVPVLVGLLNMESNPEMMLLAARAVTYLCDALPSACAAVVQYGAISSLCSKLLTIEFMDLAEQALQALKKISQEQPDACLRAGALIAVLSYLDFFSTGLQRVALSTAASICKKLPSDAADFVMEAVPLLINLLKHHDSKVLEDASLCLAQIVDIFSSSAERLEELCNQGLIKEVFERISLNAAGSGLICTGLARLLSTCASGSPLCARTLLLLGISGVLKDILSLPESLSGSKVFMEQTVGIVNLADELLPVLPKGAKRSDNSSQEKLFRDQPELLLQYGLDLLPVMIQIYGSCVNNQIQLRCLSVICKLAYFGTIDTIRSLVAATNMSSFIANVLTGKDYKILALALHLMEILMEKLPEVFSEAFVREGVLHAVKETAVLRDSSDTSSDLSSIRSKVFLEKYFPGDLALAETEDFCRLRSLCSRLNSEAEASDEVVMEIMGELAKENGVSTFEFIRSGVVLALLNYFSFGKFSNERASDPDLLGFREKIMLRFRSFASITLPVNPNSDGKPVMGVLVQKLQSALSAAESFPLVLSDSSGALKALTRLRKIQFRRAEEEKSLADFSSNIVVIDPLENLSAVEDFLWPRVQLSDSSKESCSSASERKKGKAVVGSGAEDFVGSRTRGAAQRRAKPSPSKPLSEDVLEFMSDDEFIFSEDEDVFQDEMTRMNNIIQLYTPEDVHEVSEIKSAVPKNVGDQPKLVFFSNGCQLSPNNTVIQAIHSQLKLEEEEDDFGIRKSKVYTITYQRASNVTSSSSINGSSELPASSTSLLDQSLKGELHFDLERSNGGYEILALMRVLVSICQLAPRLRAEAALEEFVRGKAVDVLDSHISARVLAEEFVNSKIALKLSKQTKDVTIQMTGTMPAWCRQLVRACPFLFPFVIRREFCAADSWRRFHRRRQKVRVSRVRVLESASAVMELCSGEDCILDVEFSGEVGTGLGPTLEFYTILSREFQREELGLWRREKTRGLFPRPWKPDSVTSKVLEYFSLLGQFTAKAIQDGRLLDLPLSDAFYKLILGQELDIYDVSMIDGELGRSLMEMKALVKRKKMVAEGRVDRGVDFLFRRSSIEDLCFEFKLPGYPEYRLKEDSDRMVDMESLEEYVELVVDAMVGSGIRRQVDAFREGFNKVFDVSSLCVFSPEELDGLICGRQELWQAETLPDHIKFDHGFTSKSPTIINFIEILGEFTPEQQRAFCQFVTGSPRLPSGGLGALSPKLTVVRKHSSCGSLDAVSDLSDDLPSVMTCANYLKLPAYSTKEIMYEKLIYAIKEGQGSFDLS